MIHSLAVDLEVFENMISFTFVDLKDYLNKFADCKDALTDSLTVEEIIKRLDSVKSWIFYVSDTDDSQMLSIIDFFEKMRPIEHEDGSVERYDLYGYNNQVYDDTLIKAFLMYWNRFDNTKQLCSFLKEVNDKIISLQDDKDALWQDKLLNVIRKYRVPYVTVDLFKIFALNSAGVNIDKDTGERKKYGKSLKQVSINLKWYNLLDFKLPPIDDEEGDIYRKRDNYRGMTNEQLNHLITADFNRYLLPKYVEPMLHYNKNDVFLCCEIVRQKPDEVILRYSLSHAYGINFLCSARSNIADKLLNKFYSERSGLHEDAFKNLRTQRTALSFNKIIFPHIKFKTKQLQDLLEEMKKVVIYRTNKDSFVREIDFYGTTYTLATGGIHTQDKPVILKSKPDEYVYVHHDYTSYYPSIMISYEVVPAHLNRKVFAKMVDYFKQTRVKCKHTDDKDGFVVPGVHNKLAAEALKIVINAIYGKYGYENFWLYDRLAQMRVTINGQLMTMTLCESLELAGIHVVSANTDGIVIKLPYDKVDVYNQICKEWNETNKMSADDEHYKMLVSLNVNNYFDIQSNDKIEYKGALDPKQYIKDLKKGYDMPVVATAVFEYFAHGKSVMETLRNHKDILDFCKTQNVGRQFEVVYDVCEKGVITHVHSQRHVRFYVSTKGVIIQKENKTTGARSNLAGGNTVCILNSLDDLPIEERNINYGYYYNECYKIIDPIMLGISPTQKGDRNKRILSGKAVIKKNSHQYNSLFDDEDFQNT